MDPLMILVAQSALFDPTWYLKTYPDVASLCELMSPLEHFCTKGDRECKSPGPLFNSHYYRLHFPGAASSDMGPLEHYLREGHQLGYDWYPNNAATADDVRWAATAILGREADASLIDRCLIDHDACFKPFLYGLTRSEEGRASMFAQDDLSEFRVPRALTVTSVKPKRILAVGSCLLENMINSVRLVDPECQFEHHLQNFGSLLPTAPQHDPSSYDFQVVGLGMRSVTLCGEHAKLPLGDKERHARFFEDCRLRLTVNLQSALAWNERYSLKTFVLGFIVPQSNQNGRLQARYDLSNFSFLVERLNQLIYEEVQSRQNCYFIDINEIVSSFGKKYYLDDIVFTSDHNAPLTDGTLPTYDVGRLEGVFRTSQTYPRKNNPIDRAIWDEIIAAWRTSRSEDLVKLVIVDLDDTLWRGVAAEADMSFDPYRFAGWPEGVAEALQVLKARGIVLAIASKNDESFIAANWVNLVGRSIALEDFAVRLINWNPKTETVQEIVEKVNVLPRSVVFIDDNPVEREAVQRAFPDIRTLPSNYLTWRRILLWSSETQVPDISAESASRNTTVQASIKREELRAAMSREEFLRMLKVRLTLDEVTTPKGSAFRRSLELINKTNQFNTTGRRWDTKELEDLIANGGTIIVADVADEMTTYGITCVAVLERACVLQMVLSCRVFGLGVETAMMSWILSTKSHLGEVCVNFTDTGRNHLCVDFFERCGFARSDRHWSAQAGLTIDVPAHLTVRSQVTSTVD